MMQIMNALAYEYEIPPQNTAHLRVLPDIEVNTDIEVAADNEEWLVPDVEMTTLDWDFAEVERANRNWFLSIAALSLITILAVIYIAAPLMPVGNAAISEQAQIHKGNGIAVVQVQESDDYYQLANRIGAQNPTRAGQILALAFDNSELEPGRLITIDTAKLGIATTHWQP